MTVHYDIQGRRATVRIDRPDVLNALNRDTLDALALRFREAAADDQVGVVVLTGTGRAFCTGADLDEQKQFLDRPNDYWAWMGHFIAAIDAIRDCSKPVVARLNGLTVGGGNEINLACDLAVAADDVVFRHVGPSRGSLPAGGATQWMPIFVGERRAREVLMLNQPIGAEQALDWGWVNRVVPRDQLDATVDELCGQLLDKMPEILRATKAQLNFWKDLSWSLTIRGAREWLTVHAASREVAEGLASFEEKRPVDYERLRGGPAARGTATDAAPQPTGTEEPMSGAPPDPGTEEAMSGAPPEPGDPPVDQEIHDV
ncbi:MAG: enoyl-CoA hydratase/isomerase family protein [Chloroflexi bacterium]|nr:enoyl-CoA hydratase/isomerase family protein [Chloroflexota bacterium]